MPVNSTTEALHVLHLSSWYPEGPNSRNGIFIIRQVEALAAQGVTCGLVASPLCDTSPPVCIKQEIQGVWHHVNGYTKGQHAMVQAWRQFIAIRQALRGYQKERGKPSLLVVHVAWKAGWWALWLHYRHRIPLVLAEHWSGYLPENKQFKGFLLRWLTRKLVQKAAFVVCPSAVLAEAMQAHGLQNRYVVIPNVVDTATYSPNKTVDKGGYFLHVSNLAPVKRFDLVLTRFQRFRNAHPQAKLLVAGAFDVGAANQKFQGQLEGVTLLGVQSAADLAALYRSAVALLLCSSFETFSIVVPEALACRCTVLAPALPALRQHLPLGGLHLLEPLNEDAWQEAMRHCWLQPSSEVAAEWAPDEHPYSPAMVGRQWLSLLKRLKDVA